MPPVSKRTRRYLVTAALVVLLANPLSWTLRPYVHGITALIFGILALVWTETLRTRLSGETMRRCMLAGAFLLFTLFPLRECRYTIFYAHPLVKRWLWYGYYLPTFSVPFLFFLAALCVDRREEDRPLRAARFLWIVPVVLTALCLTNDLHEAVFVVDPAGNGNDASAYGPVYWIGILWIAAVNLAAFFLLIARCRRSGSRRLWYVPVLAAVPAMALIVWYGINGGAPRFRGLPLFQYQEIYALLYVCVWEACIQIGLIPTSADYDRIFPLSSVNAAIADMDGRVVYASENAPLFTQALIRAASDGPIPVGGNRWLRRRLIPGGSVLWCEDLSEIVRLNRELEQANEALAERNAVLEAENDLLEDKARFEAANRLWDGIVEQIRPQLRTISARLERTGSAPSPTPSDEDLADCAFLGAYIKRRSNLTLMAEGAETLSTEELGLAVRESLAYLSLRGLLCDVREEGEAKLPSGAVMAAYDAFEDAAEELIGARDPSGENGRADEPGSLLVTLSSEPDGGAFSMTLLFDVTPPPGVSGSVERACSSAGLSVERWEEDGAGFLCIRRASPSSDEAGESGEKEGSV